MVHLAVHWGEYEVEASTVVVLRLWNVSQDSYWLHSVWPGVVLKSMTAPIILTIGGTVVQVFITPSPPVNLKQL